MVRNSNQEATTAGVRLDVSWAAAVFFDLILWRMRLSALLSGSVPHYQLSTVKTYEEGHGIWIVLDFCCRGTVHYRLSVVAAG
jgi:hypothetical protein